jgi:RNase P/RNase MRP subunit p30
MKDDKRWKACVTYEEKRNIYSVLVVKLEGRRQLRRTSRKWKNIIKIDHPELLSVRLSVVNLPKDGHNWLAL